MAGGGDQRRKGESAEQRKQRLAAELRANLAKRKAQAKAKARARARHGGDSADAPSGLDEDKPARE